MRNRQPRRSLACATLALGCILAAGGAQAAPGVTVSLREDGAHVVFAFPRRVGFGLVRQGDTLQLRFTGAGPVPDAAGDGRNVVAIHGANGRASVDLMPGARVRSSRQGTRIVLDVSAPPAPAPAPAPEAAPVAAAPAARQADASASTAAEPPPKAPVDLAVAEPKPTASAAAPAEPPPEAPAVAAEAAALPPGTAGTAVLLPFSARVGAAAFRRNGVAWVVFDERHPIDLDALRDDRVLSRAVVQLLTAATLLRVPLDEGSEMRLTHSAEGWSVAALPAAPPTNAIPVAVKAKQFDLPVSDPNQVVTVPDPETGQNLLVGTLRASAAGVPVARRVPAFVLHPSWQGVLVEPIADSTTLRVTREGFVLEALGEALSPAPDGARDLVDAAYLTRSFAIPTGSPEALFRRLHAQIAEAGEAPAQARGKPRKAAAATLIALALGIEAQAMLRLATEEDPRLLADPEITGLAAVAAMIGGRKTESGGISDPVLNGTDEAAFWRAVHAAQMHEGAREAAPVFAATIKLLLAYPAPLRAALLPLAAETMALGGAPDAADALLARLPDDHTLDLARALRLEDKGNTAQALLQYDALAMERDRLTAARAAARATLLRLKTKALSPSAAADALEHQFLNWRGDGRELDLRLQVAALRADTGAWRPAFSLLRETAEMYPDQAQAIQGRMAELMTALLSGPGVASVTPLDLVALTEENAELVAAVAPVKAAGLVADKLAALDLPRRAGPVLERMMRAAPVGPGQATLGARLAALRLAEGDDAGARAALANSNAPDLPAALIARRTVTAAKLAARAGRLPQAVAMLTPLGTPEADDLRATLLTDAQDWRGAAAALSDLAAKTIPSTGQLSPAQQDTILRLASALSRLGDDAGLRALGMRELARMDGPRAGMFRLLTAPPVATAEDLPRASSELSLVKAIPGGLAAIGAK